MADLVDVYIEKSQKQNEDRSKGILESRLDPGVMVPFVVDLDRTLNEVADAIEHAAPVVVDLDRTLNVEVNAIEHAREESDEHIPEGTIRVNVDGEIMVRSNGSWLVQEPDEHIPEGTIRANEDGEIMVRNNDSWLVIENPRATNVHIEFGNGLGYGVGSIESNPIGPAYPLPRRGIATIQITGSVSRWE